MAITLVVEDGTGLSNANTYVSLADADTYFESHVYSSGWDATADASKNIALAMATRLLDAYFVFEGKKIGDTQALEFPRFDIKDRSGFLIQSTTIPQALKDATGEYAQFMIASDRTADASGKGFKLLSAGSLTMQPDTNDKPPVVPGVVSQLINFLGRPAGTMAIPITR